MQSHITSPYPLCYYTLHTCTIAVTRKGRSWHARLDMYCVSHKLLRTSQQACTPHTYGRLEELVTDFLHLALHTCSLASILLFLRGESAGILWPKMRGKIMPHSTADKHWHSHAHIYQNPYIQAGTVSLQEPPNLNPYILDF